ncbi:MAG: DUF4199 domain-containing protein [Cellulophaga sp.]
MMKKLKTPIKYGIGTSGSLIAYFLALVALGLHTNGYYSFFNIILTGFGIYEVIKCVRKQNPENFTYWKGIYAGAATGFVATLIFSLFFAMYATLLNRKFLSDFLSAGFENYSNSETIVFLTVALLGAVSTVVLTLVFMQFFRKNSSLLEETRLNSKNHL